MNQPIQTRNPPTQRSVDQLRRQHQRELDEQRKYSGYELMRDLLPIGDNLERLLLTGRHTGDFDAMLDGIALIRDQFFDTLEKHGLREVAGACNPFDSRVHEDVGQRQSHNDPAGSIVEVVQQGYRLDDKVVRPSQVIVSTDEQSPESCHED